MRQSYELKEVIVSDNSNNKYVKSMCSKFSKSGLDLKHFASLRTDMAGNINSSISQATGELVKILFADDFFFCDDALTKIEYSMGSSDNKWYLSGCNHYSQVSGNFYEDFFPRASRRLLDGNNTISSPSVVTFRRSYFVPFSERLSYLIDCEWYLRMSHYFGLPAFGRDIQISNRIHVDQTTHSAKLLKEKEVIISKMMHSNSKMGLVACSCLGWQVS